MARISKPPSERKEEILLAARELFFSKGYERTSVSDIVNEVGVAQGLFYYYFKSKDDIFQAVMEHYATERADVLKTIISDEALTISQIIHKILHSYSVKNTHVSPEEVFVTDKQDLYDKLSLLIAQSLIEPVADILRRNNERMEAESGDEFIISKFLIYGVVGILRSDEPHICQKEADIVDSIETIVSKVITI